MLNIMFVLLEVIITHKISNLVSMILITYLRGVGFKKIL